MKKHYFWTGLGFLLATAALPAQAKDDKPCAPNMVCASDPATIVAAMERAGYKAKLTTDAVGDPRVDSAASGYSFSIIFYDCVDHKQCASVQFFTSFDSNPAYTEVFANKWNNEKRFLTARVNAKNTLIFNHDVSTIGGLNQDNFADLLEWMASTLNIVRDYINPKTK